MKPTAENLNTIILCEDIRTEDNGKLIIIGVFASKVLISNAPSTLQLAVYFELVGLPAGTYDITVKLYIKNDKGKTPKGATALVSMSVDLHLPEMLPIKTPRLYLPVETPTGSIIAEVSFDNQTWIKVVDRPVEVNATPNV